MFVAADRHNIARIQGLWTLSAGSELLISPGDGLAGSGSAASRWHPWLPYERRRPQARRSDFRSRWRKYAGAKNHPQRVTLRPSSSLLQSHGTACECANSCATTQADLECQAAQCAKRDMSMRTKDGSHCWGDMGLDISPIKNINETSFHKHARLPEAQTSRPTVRAELLAAPL